MRVSYFSAGGSRSAERGLTVIYTRNNSKFLCTANVSRGARLFLSSLLSTSVSLSLSPSFFFIFHFCRISFPLVSIFPKWREASAFSFLYVYTNIYICICMALAQNFATLFLQGALAKRKSKKRTRRPAALTA